MLGLLGSTHSFSNHVKQKNAEKKNKKWKQWNDGKKKFIKQKAENVFNVKKITEKI